jgi:GntR family transcriptional repressor for pyruvate dehydrogenase complex
MIDPSAEAGTFASPPSSAEADQKSPAEPSHASDQVFRGLAAAILNRELSPGTPLPPERELAERYGVSRIVVREAIHRLKEYELVRVRQGSPTLILDPDRAVDIRLLGLEIELVEPDASGTAAFVERQVYSAAALLDLAEQRMTLEEVDELEKIVADRLLVEDKSKDWLAFERTYWTAISRGTKNRIYLRETLWHFNLLERDPRFKNALTGDPTTRPHLYRALFTTLRARSGSATMYLSALRSYRASLTSIP